MFGDVEVGCGGFVVDDFDVDFGGGLGFGVGNGFVVDVVYVVFLLVIVLLKVEWYSYMFMELGWV